MERYSRNIAVNEIGEAGQRKINQARVLICGCGGLGSGVISNLAALGVGYIGLVDDDIVEISNLNRQFIHKSNNLGKLKVLSAKDRIIEINPDISIKTYPVRLNELNYENIVRDYDLLIDCFDSYRSKFLLNDIAIKCNKPLIHGGVSEFGGQVTVIIPHKTPCLRCLFPDANLDEKTPLGNISPVVNLVASIQAVEVLKLILNLKGQIKDKLLIVNALDMDFKVVKIRRFSQCPICA